MKFVRTTLLVAAFAGVLAAPAGANELPAIWTGFYVGAHGGYGEANDEPAPFDVGGGLIGMHAGYNHQMGAMVLGVEGDYDWTYLEDTQTAGAARVTLDVDQLASIRARLGYAWGQALLYGTVGYAWGEAGTAGDFGGLLVSRSTDFDGLVAGGGLEYKFAPDWSARVEGLQYWLEPDSSQDVDDLDVTVVRAGVSWHFNTR
ncbi:MAG: outer membrane beta-barrel protein [Hyphomicrobium sp.]|nr:outer membrane beta-barrel protein [Hyphomicrobium sp.]